MDVLYFVIGRSECLASFRGASLAVYDDIGKLSVEEEQAFLCVLEPYR